MFLGKGQKGRGFVKVSPSRKKDDFKMYISYRPREVLMKVRDFWPGKKIAFGTFDEIMNLCQDHGINPDWIIIRGPTAFLVLWGRYKNILKGYQT